MRILQTCLLAACLLLPAAQAAKPALLNFGKGLLWRIDAPGIKPSYLFGTIHSDDPRVTKLPQPVTQAFHDSSQLVIEIAVTREGMLTMSQSMFLPQYESLQNIIGINLYDDTRLALKKRGMTDEHLNRLRPWLVITMLSMPPRQDGSFLDMNLHNQAVKAGKPVHGLESMMEQIEVFDGLSLADQVELLRAAVEKADKVEQETEEMIRAWLARDLRMLDAIARKNEAQNPKLHRRFMRRLLHDRNQRMYERMQPALATGDAFIAVGALHLGGHSGLLQQLYDNGFRLTAVY